MYGQLGVQFASNASCEGPLLYYILPFWRVVKCWCSRWLLYDFDDDRELWAWQGLLFSFGPQPVFPRFLPPFGPFFLKLFTSQCPPFFLETSFLSSFLPVHPLSYVSIILMPMSWGCFCWCLMMLVMRREKWYQHLLIRIIRSSASAHQLIRISSSAHQQKSWAALIIVMIVNWEPARISQSWHNLV